MVRLGKTQRRWKRAVVEAVAPERLTAERDLAAAEIAKRIWVANGGADWASAEDEGSLLALETLVGRYLSDGLLRALLGLRHLRLLEDGLRQADYEEAPGLTAELRWTESYLEGAVFSGDTAFPEPLRQGLPEPAATRGERLYQELAQLVLTELKAAEIAA